MLNKDITKNYKSLLALKEKNTEYFPIGISYAIIHNLNLLAQVQEEIDTARQAYLEKYAKPDLEQPGYYLIETPEQRSEYNKQITELENTETPIKLIKLKLDNLNAVQLSLEDMYNLYFMIEEEQ